MCNSGIIYKSINLINNKIYIGQTKNTIKQRISNHLSSAKRNINMPFSRALKKYGIENFKWEILEKNIKKADLNNKERFYIKKFNSTNKTIGYNICLGGEVGELNETFRKNITASKLKAGIRADNKSGFKGVSKTKNNIWVAQMSGKNLGYFENPVEAAKAYDKAAIEMHGEGNVSTNETLNLYENKKSLEILKKYYKVRKTNKSGYKGVCWNKKAKKWEVHIKGINLGLFTDLKEAAISYDKKAIEIYGNEAITNKKIGLL